MGNVITPTQLPVTITSNFNQAQLLSALQQNFAAIVAGLQATQGYCNNSVAPAINLSGVANTEILGSQIAGFSRPSTAYTLEGVQVGTHIPRYEQIDTNDFLYGLLMEEGTTNLLTANWSNPTSTTGWDGGGAGVTHAFSISSSTYWTGGTSLQDVVTGFVSGDCYICTDVGGNEGICTPVSPSTAYAFSGHAQAPVGAQWYLRMIFWNSSGASIGQAVGPTMTGTGAWQYSSGTLTTPSTAVYVSFRYQLQANGTWYFGGLQIEQKAYATSWITGGATRSSETMIIPTAGIFTPGSWTVEMRYTPKDAGFNTNEPSSTVLWDLYINNNNRYILYVNSTTGCLTTYLLSGGNLITWADTTPLVLGNTYEIMFAGNGSTAILCKNGLHIGPATTYVELTGTLPAWMYIGSNYTGQGQCNGILDDLCFSNTAHTITDHQNYISSNQPHPVQGDTTLLMEFDQTLRQTSVQRLTNVQGTFVIADALTTSDSSKATHIVPTGWTTAEATIMQAMSELPATGGSIVLLDGTFIIDDQLVIFISAITLTGQGASTIIKLNAAIVQSSTFGLVINNPSISTTGITLSNFTLNNYSYSYQATNDREDAIYGLSFAPSGVALDGNTSAPTIASLTINGFAQNGMNIFSTGAIVTNNIVQNKNNGSWGIITTGTYANISNNQVSNNGMHGLVIEGSHNTISGNTCQGNGQDGVSSNIYLMATASYNNIQGNTCRTGTNAVKPKYGIDISVATCVANVISSNDCYTGGATAGIADSGTTTNFGAGNRVNSGAWSLVPS
jgi:parallel beta-helix repeat protein